MAARMMRYRDQNGQDWADILDFFTMHPDARRQVTRIIGEICCSDGAMTMEGDLWLAVTRWKFAGG